MSLYKNIAKYYDQIFPLRDEKKNFVNKFFPVKDGLAVDIGCANGNFTFFLEEIGYKPVGIDLNKDLIKLAIEKKEDVNSQTDFQVLDMVQLNKLFKKNSLSRVFCFGNTLVHLKSKTEIKNFGLKIFDLLQPGGSISLQIVNYDRIFEQDNFELPVIESEEFIFKRKYILSNKSQLDFQTELVIKKNGKSFSDSTELYPIKFIELSEILTNIGFETEYFGDFKGNKYTFDSPALICIATKPA